MTEPIFYVDTDGNQLGQYHGSKPEGTEGVDYFEASGTPNHGKDKYIDGSWQPYPDAKPEWQVQREHAYIEGLGAQMHEITNWLLTQENPPLGLLAVIDGVKQKYPKE